MREDFRRLTVFREYAVIDDESAIKYSRRRYRGRGAVSNLLKP